MATLRDAVIALAVALALVATWDLLAWAATLQFPVE